MQFYSLSVAIKGQKCVVVGGGKVALRKVRKLCAAEADVLVVAPKLLPEFYKEKNITVIESKYSREVLEGAFLVFAATSDFSVNQRICEDAKHLGIWVNSVNGAEYGSFIIPATCQKSILRLGITTEGQAPILSKEVRKYLQKKVERIPESLIGEIVELRKKKVAAVGKIEREDLEKQLAEKAGKVVDLMENE